MENKMTTHDDAYDKIANGKDVRQQLILLNKEAREPGTGQKVRETVCSHADVFFSLLEDEDPKVRKNTARLLGELETEGALPFLFDAFKKETTLYVRADYIRAMSSYDCSEYLPYLRERMKQLSKQDIPEESRKHCREELLALSELLALYESGVRHRFTDTDQAPELILLTNRNHREVTAAKILTGEKRLTGAGVRVKGGSMKELTGIRTWSEMLFVIPGSKPVSGKPAEIGEELAGLDIAGFLNDWHTGSGVWKYRLEVKGSFEPGRKGVFIRRVCEALDRYSKGTLLNSTSGYELEIRLIQKKDGTYIPFLLLFTLRDRRFAYRKESVAASINPVHAALVMELARPYMKDGAQVLDPFCGVGTMLIERAYCMHTGDLYGVDIFGEAIQKARRNTEVTGIPAHYINRDIFDFSHQYPFEEIVTDMPRFRPEERLRCRELYHRFFEKMKELLAREAVLILFTCESDLVRQEVQSASGYRICLEKTILEKMGAKIMVIAWSAG